MGKIFFIKNYKVSFLLPFQEIKHCWFIYLMARANKMQKKNMSAKILYRSTRAMAQLY